MDKSSILRGPVFGLAEWFVGLNVVVNYMRSLQRCDAGGSEPDASYVLYYANILASGKSSIAADSGVYLGKN